MQRLHNIPAVENCFLRLNNNTEILSAEQADRNNGDCVEMTAKKKINKISANTAGVTVASISK